MSTEIFTKEERDALLSYGTELHKPVKTKLLGRIPTDGLKEQQLEAYNTLETILDAPSSMSVLRGYAGTGKTYLLGILVTNYKEKYPSHNVCMTAPTNKAVKELKKATDFGRSDIGFSTLHSLLGLREQINRFGKLEYKPDRSKPNKLQAVHLLIVDEVSMLNTELFDMLTDHTNSFSLRIIFTGDPKQIPPVSQDECMPFKKEAQEMYDMTVCDLTEIIRQNTGNPIIEGTLKIRTALARPDIFPIKRSTINEKGAMAFVSRTDPFFDELLYKHFLSHNFQMDSDYAKVIGWTNKTVNDMNSKIRSMIYPKDHHRRINEGEKLVMDGAYVDDNGKIVLTTNDEIVVNSFTHEDEVINNGDYILKYYNTEVQYGGFDGEPIKTTLKILHEDSQVLFDQILEVLIKDAKSKARGSYQSAEAWTSYYGMLRYFAQIKYAYALTAHKAQGSTYRNVFVMDNDLNKNRQVEERNRIKYTAFSRAAEKLFVIY